MSKIDERPFAWLQKVRFGVNLFLLLCPVLDIGRFRVDPILF
jgi:hypothetical protein